MPTIFANPYQIEEPGGDWNIFLQNSTIDITMRYEELGTIEIQNLKFTNFKMEKKVQKIDLER